MVAVVPIGFKSATHTRLAGITYDGQGPGKVKLLLQGPTEARVEVFRPGCHSEVPFGPASNFSNVILASCAISHRMGGGVYYEVLEQWEWVDAYPFLSVSTSRSGSGNLDQLCVSRWVSLTRSQAPGQLLPIRDGLMLDPVELEGMTGWRVVATIPGLNLDLEGLQVVRDQVLAAFIQDIRKSMEGATPP